MIGRDNVSNEPLQKLMTSDFSKAELFGKLANICGDLPGTIMEETGDFKNLTGQDTISAQRKFGQPFQYDNYAKLIFNCNQLPKTKDNSNGFWDRWILLNFPYRFEYKEIIDDDHNNIDNFMGIPHNNWGGIGVLFDVNSSNIKLDEFNINNRKYELLKERRLDIFDDVNGVNLLAGLQDFIDQFITNNSIGVEIGSYVGKSSELFALHCKEITCVDPWVAYNTGWSQDFMNDIECRFDVVYNKYSNMKKMKGLSTEMSKNFADNSLDFVYIDGSHDYKDVKEDIEEYLALERETLKELDLLEAELTF
jgi:hypothetical protein